MNFSVVYVEDDWQDRKKLEEAVKQHNDTGPDVVLSLKVVKSPDEVKQRLEPSDDLVLSDVYWKKNDQKPVDRLTDVINAVQAWHDLHKPAQRMPVIAYTGYGAKALNACLQRKQDLFDIWDKSFASEAYVTWRLSQLAIELSRLHPDNLIHRLIREMPSGASWHGHVREMTDEYNAGFSEYDQIERAGHLIGKIAHALKVRDDAAKEMWGVMERWEALSRAISSKTRGHARHVINVFWLGYYLLHHHNLKPWFCDAWEQLIESRTKMMQDMALIASKKSYAEMRLEQMSKAKDKDPAECLSNAWYYAGLFHDVAGCVEMYPVMRTTADELASTFIGDVPSNPGLTHWLPGNYSDTAEDLFTEYSSEIADALRPVWQKSVTAGRPDHGVIAALAFRNRIKRPEQQCFVYEAARAMAVHNLISDLDANARDLLTWSSDPLVCLLLLCDQIQTWDRERGDERLTGPENPQRAQLADIKIEKVGPGVHISMCIDYIASRHLDHDPDGYNRVRLRLEKTLMDSPNRALRRIAEPWPFALAVECRLSGRPLLLPIRFGEES